MKRIDQLKQQREQLDKRIRELAAADQRAARDLDKRQKIIIGGWVLKHRPQLVNNVIANLEREQDKAAFANWPTTETAAAPASAPQSTGSTEG